jgi:hypothetical protein
MNGLHIWHFVIAVLAAAVLSTVARFDCACAPVSPIVTALCFCEFLGIQGARWRGRRWQTDLLLGLLLGPLGVILACSNPIPERFKFVALLGRKGKVERLPRRDPS